MKYLLVIISLFTFNLINAQGDDCSNAFDLGSLPTPNSCFGGNPSNYGVGAPITENGSTIGATAANPYVYMTGCQGAVPEMANGAVDVWYTFVATGTELQVNITGSIANPNVGIWSGNCLNLTGRGCAVGDAGGNLNETFGPLIAGETYYMQISGNAPFIQGNFTLELNNNNDCSGCLEAGFLTANPPPINGTYSAGQTVEFCYTITDYNQTNNVWLHGVQVEWGAGWETTVNDVAVTVPPSCSGSGSWVWVPGGVTGTGPDASTFPSGFYFESNSGCSPFPCDPNDPGDNYGDSGAENCDPQFCWTLTTLPPISCTSSLPLTLTVNTTADNESGSYIGTACSSDLTTEYTSILSCCAVPPDMFSTDVTCSGGGADGSATVVAQGAISPWTYQWYDESGNLISTINNSPINTNVLSNLSPGTYTCVVTDFAGCSSGNTITVNDYVSVPPTMSSTNVSCGTGASDGTATAVVQGANGPWTYVWFDQSGTPISTTPNSFVNSNTATNLAVGNYSVVISDASGCTSTNDVSIVNPVLVTPTFDPLGVICEGDPINLPTTSIEGINGIWDPAPNSNASATYTFIPFPGQCANTTTMFVQVEAAPTATISGGNIVCTGGSIDLTATLGGLFTSVIWSSPDGTFSSNTGTITTFTPSVSSGTATVIATASSFICISTNQDILELTIGSSIVPTFDGVGPICSGTSFTLPSTSTNGITGSWSPIENNTVTTNYTFTPDPGQCALGTTITVEVLQALSATDTQTACDTYTWIDGNTYTTSNNSATWTLTNASGCDSTVTLDLTITNSNTGTDVQTACDSYTWIDGNTYTTSNNSAIWTLTNASGCDSTVTLDLTITNSNTGTDVQTACDSYTWIDGNTYTTSNNSAIWTLTNASGCDSTVTLDLTITNSNTGTDVQTACDSYTWIDGNTYTTSNNSATWTLTNASGCDSTVTLDLTITNSNTGTDVQTACDSYTWIDGNTYTTSNNSATWILTNASGCDSTVTLDLTITNSNTGTDVQSACDSYTWIDGNTYTTSNNSATWILTNASGCDSTVTLDLTITNSNTGTDVQTACDTYTWIDGNTYTTSNNSATWTLTNVSGCDSTVTLDLTITNSNTGTDVQTACDTYTWIDGNTYTTSNNSATWTLTNVSGCDSTVTLDLTITNSNTGTDVHTACDSYTWIDGNTYTTSNNSATVMLSTTDGCDSLVTLDLSINNSYSTTDIQGACDSYTWIDGNTYTSSNNTATMMLTSVAGCDSLVTLDLTIDNSLTGTDVQTACDSYTWIDGVTYTSSNNTATIILSASGGCDSTVTLDLTITNSNTGTDVQTACDSYTWIDGNTYTTSNNSATWTLTNASGCDSTVTLDLTITNSNTGTDVQTACDSYTWIDGNTYTTSNNSAIWTLTNASGCDSTVTLDLTITNSNTGTDVQTACDSYTWIDGNTYTTSNNSATWTLTNASGCDSTVTLDLTITNSNTGTDVQTACDSYTWIDGNTYTTSNNSATWILTNASGCDSTVTLDLTITNSNTGTDVQSACDSYTWIDGNTYTTSNNSATWILTNASGCDSTVTLDLTITNSNTGTDVQTACDTYTWIDGNTYTTSNNSATWTLTNVSGCDSTVTLDLTITNSNTGTDVHTACDSYTWIDGNTYTTSNNSATVMLSTTDGCDSLVTLDLSINNSYSTTDIQGACDSYTWIDGNTYTSSNNTATMMLTSVAGCDSLVTLDLTIDNSLTGTDVQTACDSYTWIDGVTYTSSNNTATVLLTASGGCDSLVTLDLTIGSSNTGTDVQTACDSYTWIDGNTYTTSNNSATWILTNASGCDSTVTLDLTITNSNTGTDVQTACDTYTWIDGNTYTTSNNSATWILTNASGCDSTVTLDLTITNSNTGTDVQTACDSYTWIDGNTYTTSNNSATWILTNASGCDSIVTLDLTITNSNTGTDVQTACDSYTWIDGNTYTTSNNSATWTLTNASGCDSTVTLDLTINNTPSFTVSGTDPSVCNANDGSITISGLNPSTDYTLSYDSLSVASQIITITTDASGEYIISGLLAGLYADFNIELNSCSFTLNQTVDLNNPGAPSLDALSSTTECDTYTLPAITGTNLSGNQSYYTQSNGAGTPLNEGDVISSTQTIYIYDILGTCADESNFTITIDYTPSLTNPGPQDVCESYFLPLSITGTNLSGNENYYSDLQSNGGTIITDAITSSQTVYIYDANGNCSNEISFEVTVNPLPSLVSFTGEGTYCEGDDVNNLIVEVSGAPDYTLDYTLNGNPTTISSSNSSIDLGNASGTYVLTALADNACGISLDQTQTIIVNPLPSIPTVSEDASYCSNAVAEDLQASGSSGNYSWYSDASLSELIGSNQSYSPDMIMGITTYYVTATQDGCEGLPAEVSITFENCEIIIPTAFTPDDDQVNDTWNLGDIDVIYPNNVVSVYNRLGNKVYESDQGAYSQRPWNGTFNEKALPVASYYFIIEFNDSSTQNKTGIVSIVR